MNIPVSGTALDTTRGAVSLTGITVPLETHQAGFTANNDLSRVADKMAASMVRRLCNQHGCTMPSKGVCTHPNHARDVDLLLAVLRQLDLPGDFEEITEEDRTNLLTSLAQQNADTALIGIEPNASGDDI